MTSIEIPMPKMIAGEKFAEFDWIGIGDKLTYVALTNMALLHMEYDMTM